jgi:hypothetical protein
MATLVETDLAEVLEEAVVVHQALILAKAQPQVQCVLSGLEMRDNFLQQEQVMNSGTLHTD